MYKNAYATMGDPSGITVANGRHPFIVGQNHMDVKDAEGKPFIKIDWEDIKKNGYTQHEYKWMDPKTKKIETRTLKSELVDCGAPRGKLSASITYEGKM
jgi:signal transduction histidine kinase